ncbi:hypothetical protein LUZ60_015698 [Juncus effusus]|nr:hypothetical protein LUZ60_015698 [Juncus effusus]
MAFPLIPIPLLLLVLLSLSFPSPSLSSCSSDSLPSNRIYTACNDLPHLSSSLHFSYENSTGTLNLAFSAAAADGGWVAWAINPVSSGMVGSQALIAFKQPNGSMGVKTYNVTSKQGIQEGAIMYKTSDLAAEYGSDGRIRLFAKVVVGKGITSLNQVWQVGGSVTKGVPDIHDFNADNLAASGKLDLVKGVSTGGSSSAAGSTSKKRNIHGILNGVSWGILIPLGAMIARYVRVFEAADPAWFYMHVSCQLAGYGLGVAGWATGINLGKESKGITFTTHRNIGIAIFALATLQIFALFLRPNKDNKFRFYWNIYHHSVGYTVIILGAINIFRGLTILQSADKWRYAYIAVICILVLVAIILEAATWCVVLKRRKNNEKTYNSNGNGSVQQPFSV